MNSSCQGYLCLADDGYWYLCQSPNVKSCCIKKETSAIRLDGDFSGYNTKKPIKIIDGQVIVKQGMPYCTLSLIGLAGLILLLTYLKRRMKRESPPPL